MKFIKNNIILIILVIAALILGVKVLQKFFPGFQLPKINKESVLNSSKPQANTDKNNGGKGTLLPIPDFVKKLSPDEQKVWNVPAPSAPDAVKSAHFELASKIAQKAEFIDVSECPIVKPLVFKNVLGAEVVLKNNSSEEHTVNINNKTSYTVPANGSTTIKTDFIIGPGLYGYGCDHSPYGVAFFLPAAPEPTTTP